MNDDQNKLRLQHHQAEHTTSLSQTGQQRITCEFTSAEEIIRTDRNQTEVPVEIARRLNVSIANEPKSEPPWWKKFFQRPRA